MKLLIAIFFLTVVLFSDTICVDSSCINKNDDRAYLSCNKDGLSLKYKAGTYKFKYIKGSYSDAVGDEHLQGIYKSKTHIIELSYYDLRGYMDIISPNGYKSKYECRMVPQDW